MEDNLFKIIFIIIITAGITQIFTMLVNNHFQLSYYEFATIMFVIVIFATMGFIYVLFNSDKKDIEENNNNESNIENNKLYDNLVSKVEEINKKVEKMAEE